MSVQIRNDDMVELLSTDFVLRGNPVVFGYGWAFDDGVGDSPSLCFIGGSNDDTYCMFCEDDAVAGNSDFVVTMPAADADARFIWRNSTPADIAHVDAAGNVFCEGNITVTDEAWIGIGAAAERITFDTAGDISFMGCDVGIGTTGPDEMLHLFNRSADVAISFLGNEANIAITENSKIIGAGDTGTGGQLQFLTKLNGAAIGSVPEMVIRHNGNVGIGTTAPGAKLEVRGNSSTVGGIQISNSNDRAHTWLPYTDGNVYITGDDQTGSGYIIFRSDNGTTYTEHMRIEAGGNVGIGTTGPSAQLQVDQSAAGGAQPVLLLDQGDVSEQHIVCSINGADVDFPAIIELNVTGTPTFWWDESEDAFGFQNISGILVEDEDWIGIGAALERIVFDAAGDVALMGANFGVGTMGPGRLLDVAGFSRLGSDQTVFVEISGGLAEAAIRARNAADATQDLTINANPIMFDIATVEKARIDANGNVGIGTSVPDRLFHTQVSDAVAAAITYAGRFSHTTSNPAAALFGVGVEHELEDGGGAMQVASEVSTLWATPTAGSEVPLRRWTTYPAGAAGPGYAGFVTASDVDNVAVTIIPNGAGDVTCTIALMYSVCESGGGTSGGVTTVDNGASVLIYDDGVDRLTLAVAADGSVTVARTAGVATFDVSLLMVWL